MNALIRSWVEARVMPVPFAGCWLWLNALIDGYAHGKPPGRRRMIRVSRLVYLMHGYEAIQDRPRVDMSTPSHSGLGEWLPHGTLR